MNEKETLKRFGFNVKVERMKQDITQAQLAEMLDVHEKYVSRIETGRQNATIKTIYKLAKALNVNMDLFLKM